jgi:glutamine synthetase
MNLRKTLLFYSKKIREEYGLTPVVGGELEFYCSSPETLARYIDFNNVQIVEEKGENQFEIRTPVFNDINSFIKCITKSKTDLLSFAKKEKICIDFAAKPFAKMPGSSLHVHFNFLDSRGYNVFDLCQGKESAYLLFSVGGLLGSIRESMIFFAPHKECYSRYKKSMFTPTRISWGNNNRTAAIRIIDRMNDVRRIEHRVPSSGSDPLAVVTAIIVSIYYGLSNQVMPTDKTYGNTFDSQYKLKYLPRSLEKSQKLFNNSWYQKLFLN